MSAIERSLHPVTQRNRAPPITPPSCFLLALEITGLQSFVPRGNDMPEKEEVTPAQPAKELATAE